jgi:putative transposase
LRQIVLAMLCLTGRVTMLGLSRRSEGGGSYRTIQRWFHISLDWGMLLYSLRFQIEFNFRDAKQFWGLEDFMTVSEPAMTTAANLAFLMVNLSAALLPPIDNISPTSVSLTSKLISERSATSLKLLNLFPIRPLLISFLVSGSVFHL